MRIYGFHDEKASFVQPSVDVHLDIDVFTSNNMVCCALLLISIKGFLVCQ